MIATTAFWALLISLAFSGLFLLLGFLVMRFLIRHDKVPANLARLSGGVILVVFASVTLVRFYLARGEYFLSPWEVISGFLAGAGGAILIAGAARRLRSGRMDSGLLTIVCFVAEVTVALSLAEIFSESAENLVLRFSPAMILRLLLPQLPMAWALAAARLTGDGKQFLAWPIVLVLVLVGIGQFFYSYFLIHWELSLAKEVFVATVPAGGFLVIGVMMIGRERISWQQAKRSAVGSWVLLAMFLLLSGGLMVSLTDYFAPTERERNSPHPRVIYADPCEHEVDLGRCLDD